MSEEIYKPLIEQMTWSYSRLTAYEHCKYGWFMKYVCEEAEDDRFYASYGKYVHEILEMIFKNEIDRNVAASYFIENFSERVKGPRPRGSTVIKYINKGVDFFENFAGFGIDTVAVEKRIEFKLGGKDFVGFIDYLGRGEDGIYLIDHKSRELKNRSHRKKPTINDSEIDDMLRQLYLYSTAVMDEYGEYPKWLCFNCFKNGQFIKEEFDIKKYQETVDWALRTIEKIENTEKFNPTLDYFWCNEICGLSDACCYKNM